MMAESASLYHNSLKSFKEQRVIIKKKNPPISVSFHQSIHFSVCLFVRIFNCIIFQLSIFLTVCLAACLFVLLLSKGAVKSQKTSCDFPFAHEAIVFCCFQMPSCTPHCVHLLLACALRCTHSITRSLAHSRACGKVND